MPYTCAARGSDSEPRTPPRRATQLEKDTPIAGPTRPLCALSSNFSVAAPPKYRPVRLYRFSIVTTSKSVPCIHPSVLVHWYIGCWPVCANVVELEDPNPEPELRFEKRINTGRSCTKESSQNFIRTSVPLSSLSTNSHTIMPANTVDIPADRENGGSGSQSGCVIA